jgi:hypothetical protein
MATQRVNHLRIFTSIQRPNKASQDTQRPFGKNDGLPYSWVHRTAIPLRSIAAGELGRSAENK